MTSPVNTLGVPELSAALALQAVREAAAPAECPAFEDHFHLLTIHVQEKMRNRRQSP